MSSIINEGPCFLTNHRRAKALPVKINKQRVEAQQAGGGRSKIDRGKVLCIAQPPPILVFPVKP